MMQVYLARALIIQLSHVLVAWCGTSPSRAAPEAARQVYVVACGRHWPAWCAIAIALLVVAHLSF